MQIQLKKGFYHLMQSYRTQAGKVEIYDQYVGKSFPDSQQIDSFIYNYTLKRWQIPIEEIKATYVENRIKLTPILSQKALKSFGIRFTHNTNKIEGSKLSDRDTRSILEEGIVPSNSEVKDVLESKAHMQIYETMINNPGNLSLEVLKDWHYQLFHETNPHHAGDFRNGPVTIIGSNYVPPPARDEIDMLLEELMEWYKNSIQEGKNPVYIAAIMHLRFVSIHPFEDGNGRITRLLMNSILFHSQYPMFDLDAKDRYTYYNALEKANLKEDETYFIGWFFPRYLKFVQRSLNFR